MDSEIRRGDNISPFLFQAIQTSKIAIIVFSLNFFTSFWCLDEVAEIIRCKRCRGQLVLPVFFHVDPLDIQKQEEAFQLSFAELKERFRDDPQKVEGWRSALLELADTLGWHINDSVVEAEVIQQIVDEVVSRRLLKSKY